MHILQLNSANRTDTGQSELPHVLLIIDQLSKTLGGGERAVLQLATHLPDQGFRASILTFLLDPQSPALKMTSAPVYLLPLRRTYSIEGLRAAIQLRQFIRRERVIIVTQFLKVRTCGQGL